VNEDVDLLLTYRQTRYESCTRRLLVLVGYSTFLDDPLIRTGVQ
jgi:hypothetical protein